MKLTVLANLALTLILIENVYCSSATSRKEKRKNKKNISKTNPVASSTGVPSGHAAEVSLDPSPAAAEPEAKPEIIEEIHTENFIPEEKIEIELSLIPLVELDAQALSIIQAIILKLAQQIASIPDSPERDNIIMQLTEFCKQNQVIALLHLKFGSDGKIEKLALNGPIEISGIEPTGGNPEVSPNGNGGSSDSVVSTCAPPPLKDVKPRTFVFSYRDLLNQKDLNTKFDPNTFQYMMAEFKKQTNKGSKQLQNGPQATEAEVPTPDSSSGGGSGGGSSIGSGTQTGIDMPIVESGSESQDQNSESKTSSTKSSASPTSAVVQLEESKGNTSSNWTSIWMILLYSVASIALLGAGIVGYMKFKKAQVELD